MNDKQQLAWPSQARIIKETGLSNGAVNNHLANLVDHHWIKRESGNSRKTTRYIAILPEQYASMLDQNKPKSDTPPDGELTLHLVETNKPIFNKQIKIFKKERKKKKDFTQWKNPDWINASAWSEYEQHRIEIKKPMTDLARSKAVKQLEGLNQDQQQSAIDKTILNSWTGLFPIQEKANETNWKTGREGSASDFSKVETYEGFLAGIE